MIYCCCERHSTTFDVHLLYRQNDPSFVEIGSGRLFLVMDDNIKLMLRTQQNFFYKLLCTKQ